MQGHKKPPTDNFKEEYKRIDNFMKSKGVRYVIMYDFKKKVYSVQILPEDT
jgi:hypothetical protein